MLDIKEYVDIKEHCTFKVGGQFRYFTIVSSIEELPELYEFAKEKNLPVHILGGGSNMVFPDGVLEKVVAHINFEGFEIIEDTENYTDIKIGAGENWDSVVARTVSMNLSGIEALSAIPGTTGATPVQNVGAYGQEVKDTILSVEVFDSRDQSMKILTNKDCKFGYRDSIFKGEARGIYVIVSIIFRLSKKSPTIPNYPGVKKYFFENNVNNPTLVEIREAIIAIRKNKLPDPKEVFNVGSFFKNPIVEKRIGLNLAERYSDLKIFPAPSVMQNEVEIQLVKISAGFLVEASGLKGKNFGAVSTYENNALVLVNNGIATRFDVIDAKDEIIKTVYDKFGITLETEPEFV